MAGLTGKRKLFIEEYLTCWNATEAARRAGYKHPRRQGSRLLSFVDIKDAIRARLQEKAMDADEVLARLADQGKASIAEFLKVTQDGVAIDWITVEQKGHLVKSLTPTAHGMRLELYDAQSALVQIGRAHGLFVDRHQHDVDGVLEIHYTNDWRDQATIPPSGADDNQDAG